MDLALPALDHAMPGETDRLTGREPPRWTLGGGTALALHLGHRTSDDVDVFLSSVRLAEMTPPQNPSAKMIAERFQWPGHYVKYQHALGEIDFLASPLQTRPGFTVEMFRGRQIALETPEEVLTKKLRYRGPNFTERDAFDLACVLKARPEVALTLALEAGDALPRARLAVAARAHDGARARIRDVGPDFVDVSTDITGRALRAMDAIERLRDDPISPGDQRRIAEIVAGLKSIGPGPKAGIVAYRWSAMDEPRSAPSAAILKARPYEAGASLIEEWRRRSPESLERWNARGRRPEGTSVEGRSTDRKRSTATRIVDLSGEGNER